MWWLDVLIILVLVAGLMCFLQLVGFRGRILNRRTDPRAEDLYPAFAEERRWGRRRNR
jgi:hypothetical protein